MTVTTGAGSGLYIGPTNSVANDATAYGLLSYVAVGEVENLGEIGDEFNQVNFASLTDNRMRHFKGVRDAGVLNVTVGSDYSNAGQTAMLVASREKVLTYAFKIQLPDKVTASGTGTILYWRGKIFSEKLNIGDVNNIVRRNFPISVDSDIIVVNPT